MPVFRRRKKRKCQFCAAGKVPYFLDIEGLVEFINPEKKKILPRRVSGTCTSHQRSLAISIKRARYLAILPYTAYTGSFAGQP